LCQEREIYCTVVSASDDTANSHPYEEDIRRVKC
jgi:hypothetical protein